MIKDQINVRISEEARGIIKVLIDHFTDPETGRRATQGEIMERAIRRLASTEKIHIPKKAKV